MGKIFGGGAKAPKVTFQEPKAVEAPAAAVAPQAAPPTEVDTGSTVDSTVEELRRKYRPIRSGIGSTGTGLSV